MRKKAACACVCVLGLVVQGAAIAADSLDPVIVTATRIGNKAYELTGDVTVIDAERIEASGARTVADALEQIPGVFVYDRNTAKTTVADIRGFGDGAVPSTLVLVNGRRLNSTDLSGPDLIQIPVEAVDRIEVLRGAGSVLYGDNAAAGVVNIITKKGGGDPRVLLTNQAGSHDRYKATGQATGAAGDFGYFVYGGYDEDRGYRDRSDVLSRNFNTRLTRQVNERLALDLEIGGHRDQTELPGGLDENELARLGRRGSADNSESRTKDVYGRLSAEYALGPEGNGEWGRFIVDLSRKEREVFDSFFGSFNSDRDIDQWSVSPKYVFSREIWEREVDFVVGTDIYDTENQITGSGTNTDDITITKDEFGVYGFAEVEVWRGLFVNTGGRYQEAEYEFDNRANRTRPDRETDEWTGLFGAKYALAPGTNVFASAQKTFRFLATDEWYSSFSGLNADLDQQKGMQYEAGARIAAGEAVSFSVVPYRIDIDDEIYYDPSAFSNSNYDRTRREGVESSVVVNLLKIWDIDHAQKFETILGYTYQEARFNGGLNDGRTVPLVPDHQFSHQTALRLFEKFLFSFKGRLVGERVIGNDLDNDKAKAGRYYVADLRSAYTVGACEFFVEVNNVFDERFNSYEIEKSAFGSPNVTRDVYPAEARNFNAGIRLTF